MRNPFHTPLVAVFQNEVLLNSKRVAPYALMLLFAANALLWWVKGPAAALGWATNSDFYIVRNLKGFSFLLGLPIFNAVLMGDPVIRDFRFGIAPMIFSKPVSRAQYLLGKFLGSFFVLVCCQVVFALTLLVLQAFRPSWMVVQPVRVLPYFKHFFFFVVITHLVLAAFYFTVGTLTRNSKIVYGLAVCFYPLYIAYQAVLLKRLPTSLRNFLDPFLLEAGSPSRNGFGHSADFLNQFVVAYSPDMVTNRAVMILTTAICLTILYARFTIAEPPGRVEGFSTFNLSTAADRVYYDSDSLQERSGGEFEKPDSREREVPVTPLPEVARANEGIRSTVNKLIAALGVEFRLLRAERSLVVIMPLAIFLSILEVAFYEVIPDVSYSAAYATNTAKLLLLFLLGMTVFYTSEAMHRDGEVRAEPVLWSMPIPNSVLLLSKFLTTISLATILLVLVSLTAIAIQLLRGHTPVDVSAHLITYLVILFPTIVFVTAATIALNVLLRDRYLVYAVCIATGAGLFYLYTLGYNHWLYNPALYQLWTYSDLTGAGSGQGRILTHRIYWLALSCLCLALAQLGFRRKSAKGFTIDGRLGGTGWALVITVASAVVASVTGLMIN